jgi:hypothetical protein
MYICTVLEYMLVTDVLVLVPSVSPSVQAGPLQNGAASSMRYYEYVFVYIRTISTGNNTTHRTVIVRSIIHHHPDNQNTKEESSLQESIKIQRR